MSLLAKALAAFYRSGIRGSTRLSDFLSRRIKSLQSVPIEIEGGTLFADLRISTARGILANPKCQSGEDIVMRKFIRKGDIVFDIGAHLGFYTLLLSKLAGDHGRVYTFEPNRELLPSLRRTVGPISNVELLEIALSDSEGEMNLYVPEDASMASLSDWTNGIAGEVHIVGCVMKRMDDLIENGTVPIPNFIKCDVEGAELSVFQGGMITLDRADAPVLLFELNAKAAKAFGWETQRYFELLESLQHPGYKFFEVTSNGISDLRSLSAEYANVVAVPEYRL
ncbi:MAG: FkbM family methyltransferase [Blastocatellia bacterium]